MSPGGDNRVGTNDNRIDLYSQTQHNMEDLGVRITSWMHRLESEEPLEDLVCFDIS